MFAFRIGVTKIYGTVTIKFSMTSIFRLKCPVIWVFSNFSLTLNQNAIIPITHFICPVCSLPSSQGILPCPVLPFPPLGPSPMGKKNCSVVTEFILLGIPHTKGLKTMLFVLFLPFYACTLLGNVSILVAILSSTRLHTPMYFFPGNLSVTCVSLL